MIEQPPHIEAENLRPDEELSLTDSCKSKKGYYTPKTGEELHEIKQLLMGYSNSKYENSSNAHVGASDSSKASKEVNSSGFMFGPMTKEDMDSFSFAKLEEGDVLEPLPSKHTENLPGMGNHKLKEPDLVAPPLADEVGSSFYEDSDSSEDEGLPDYKSGGYHPVHVGEIYIERYIIIQKLGWGHFSTVWLAKDLKYDTFVALKVQKSASHYIEAAYDEVEILDQVSSFWKKKEWQDSLNEYYKDEPEKLKNIHNSNKYCHTVQLLNSFMHQGPNGMHFVMVFQILGVNLLEIIKRYDYKGVPVPIIKRLSKQCLIGLDYLHRICKLIHTDLKPENVVISLTEKELKEIKEKGMLTTTKMYDQKTKLIHKTIKDATNIQTHRNGREFKLPSARDSCTTGQEGFTDRSNCDTTMSRKDKERNRKNKKKKVKKYIKQGRLPENYSTLPQEEKDSLYNAIRKEVELENLQRAGIDDTNNSDKGTMEESEPAQSNMRTNDIDVDFADVNLDKNQSTENSKSKDKSQCFEIPRIKTELMNNDKSGNSKDNPISKEEGPKPTKRGPKLDEDAMLTIVDMGNGCWTHHHYTSQIQTRQYRSPETIIGVPYGPSADIWSMGCLVFELLTGDFVFEPKKGSNYDKDDDHLAQMIELLGPMPKNMALSGKNSRRFFDSTGHLRRIRGLNYWPIDRVLIEKYRFKPEIAYPLADFFKKTFSWEPEKRATAQELLEHPFIKNLEIFDSNLDPSSSKLSMKEYEEMIIKIKKKEEVEKRKKELEIILNNGPMPPEIMHKLINSDNDSELVEDAFEINCADIEDNPFYLDDFSDEESISLGYGDSDNEQENLFVGGGYGKGKALNNSFTGPYGNMDHIHFDKGNNEQFMNIQ
jgi:serine/threonine-protein kinase SRPK3